MNQNKKRRQENSIRLQKIKMKKKDIYTLIGFILFATGLTSIIFNIVGVEWVLLKWLSNFDPLFGFILKLFMIVGGMIMIYMSKVNFRE